MALYLYIVSGKLKGERFQVKDGLTLGRSKADLNLKDTKASSLHGKISINSAQRCVFVDSDSTNGTYFEGQKVRSVELYPGVAFKIGRTVLEVREVKEAVDIESNSVAPPAPEPSMQEVRPLIKLIEKGIAKIDKDNSVPLAPLNPVVQLVFLGGLQTTTEWTLGYGPRQIGPMSLEFPLWGEGLPDVCFEVLPSKDGPLFKTDHKQRVLLNGHSQSSEVLKGGEVITIQDIKIQVGLVDDKNS